MATTPQPPPKPQTPPPPPKPAEPKPEAAALSIGAKPTDPHDPQAQKFESHPAPPRWDEKAAEHKPIPPDGPSVADVQRESSLELEKEGLAAYLEAHDTRPKEDRPKFDKTALAGGGAFIVTGKQGQVAGVAAPTKRE